MSSFSLLVELEGVHHTLKCGFYLEETVDLTSFGIHIDIEVARCGGQAWDSLDVRSKRVPVAHSLAVEVSQSIKIELTGILRQQPSSHPESAQ